MCVWFLRWLALKLEFNSQPKTTLSDLATRQPGSAIQSVGEQETAGYIAGHRRCRHFPNQIVKTLSMSSHFLVNFHLAFRPSISCLPCLPAFPRQPQVVSDLMRPIPPTLCRSVAVLPWSRSRNFEFNEKNFRIINVFSTPWILWYISVHAECDLLACSGGSKAVYSLNGSVSLNQEVLSIELQEIYRRFTLNSGPVFIISYRAYNDQVADNITLQEKPPNIS